MAVERAQASSVALATRLSAEVHQQRKPQTYATIALQSLLRDRVTLVALGFILLLALLVAFAGPLSAALVGVGPNDTNPNNSFAPPYLWLYIKWQLGIDATSAAIELGKSGGITHWLGTDQLGRDQLARLLYGGRVSLTVALVAAAISMVLGVTVGTLAGYFGSVVDDVVMWFINTIISIPTIYLLIIVTALFKPNPITLTLFLGFLGWFGTARFMRGNVFKVKALDYVLAARATGATNLRIMFQHVVPNSIPVIIIVTALDVGSLILTESALSFLGLGIQAPTATWGSMLNRAGNFVFLRNPETFELQALHLLIAPGLLITLTVLAFFLIGDGLRDALDPMLKNKGGVRREVEVTQENPFTKTYSQCKIAIHPRPKGVYPVQPAMLSTVAHAELDALLENAFNHRDVPNVVAVVANRDDVLYRHAVGVSITDIYRIASMTKPVTSVAVMMLREHGLLDLDEPLERYLPEYAGREVISDFNAGDGSFTTRAAIGPLTLRHLLTHTAGFSYDFCNDVVLALCQDGKQSPRDLPLLHDPGSRWAYSCATGILGDVIERIAGERLDKFSDTQIFQPLGMLETGYFLKPEALIRLVPLYFRVNQEWIRDPSTRPHQPFVAGDGGLLGPANDYIRFLQMLLNGGRLGNTRLLTAESVREMTSNQIGELTVERQISSKPKTSRSFPLGADEDKFGLGFQLKTNSQENFRSPGSYSWGGVFNTHFWADPQKGIVALLFTQLLPFYDEQVIRLLCDFEECIYRNLA